MTRLKSFCRYRTLCFSIFFLGLIYAIGYLRYSSEVALAMLGGAVVAVIPLGIFNWIGYQRYSTSSERVVKLLYRAGMIKWLLTLTGLWLMMHISTHKTALFAGYTSACMFYVACVWFVGIFQPSQS